MRQRLHGIAVLAALITVNLCSLSQQTPSTVGRKPVSKAAENVTNKRRVMVLTDIGDDPDDRESLVRFLTYSNEWNVAGIIVGTSIHKKNFLSPDLVEEILEAYAKVRPSLLRHEDGYPTADDLRAKVKHGLPVYGMAGVGPGKDSEASEWIVRELEKKDDRPLWISVWGGPNALAQALWKIKETHDAVAAEHLYSLLRVYTISDQDDSGPWIRKTFPSIFYVCSPGGNYRSSTWIGMSFKFPGSNTDVVSKDWLVKNVQQNHGPLGAVYPDVAYGMEGDTPSFLGLIVNGLNDPQHPDLGGWGGRYQLTIPQYVPMQAKLGSGMTTVGTGPETRPIWTNVDDTVVVDGKTYTTNQATIWRWREEYQNDFAARMCWATQPYSGCNHPPVAVLRSPAEFTVYSGEEFHLDATGSHDPDGDSLSFLWFLYPEEGTYHGPFPFDHVANIRDLRLTAPPVQAPETVHFILKVTDKGSPALTRYRRVIVHILPQAQGK